MSLDTHPTLAPGGLLPAGHAVVVQFFFNLIFQFFRVSSRSDYIYVVDVDVDVLAFLVVTLTRIMKFVVAGQAPVTLVFSSFFCAIPFIILALL